MISGHLRLFDFRPSAPDREIEKARQQEPVHATTATHSNSSKRPLSMSMHDLRQVECLELPFSIFTSVEPTQQKKHMQVVCNNPTHHIVTLKRAARRFLLFPSCAVALSRFLRLWADYHCMTKDVSNGGGYTYQIRIYKEEDLRMRETNCKLLLLTLQDDKHPARTSRSCLARLASLGSLGGIRVSLRFNRKAGGEARG
jgi:hypothetical protein